MKQVISLLLGGLGILGTAAGPATAQTCDYLRVCFAPTGTSIPAGCTAQDGGSLFDRQRGLGWDATLASRTRQVSVAPAPEEQRSFVFSTAERAWVGEIANGDYRIRVSVGDTQFAEGPHRVIVEGSPIVDGTSTAAGAFHYGEGLVSIRDGRLRVRIGGGGGVTTLNWLEARPVRATGLIRAVTFQPASERRPCGFDVDTGERFNESRGYGWEPPWTIPTRARGRRALQILDTFAFSAPERTWEMRIRPGTYHICVAVGDSQYAEQHQFVVVEGNAVVSDESTAAGAFIERCTDVEVSDGALSVRIGGGGAVTALNYVTVASAPVDSDGDGIEDGSDNCACEANPGQEDGNGNGRGDVCDLGPGEDSP